jgi:hypothetical protein
MFYEWAKCPSYPGFCIFAIIPLYLRIMEVSNNQTFNKNFIWTLKGLPPVGEKLGYNPVVFPAAGIRAVFSEVVHFTVESDKSPVGGFMFAVFWKLFFLVSHCISFTKKCQMTLFIRNTNCFQIRENLR